ncbi:MAG: DUF4159 domain-containing protein [Melioribacteraceae bacterium]
MKTLIVFFCIVIELSFAQTEINFQIARLKYNGGGDWYNDPSAEINLLNYINENTNIKVQSKYIFTDLSKKEIFNYPFLFLIGHGNISFSKSDVKSLREYFENGGFMYVDDDYGLDNAFRREIKKVFPNEDLVELPFSHNIYHSFYNFENGPPKIHEHDNNAPQGFGIFIDKRLVLYYTYESNPSDGWADASIHNDPATKREEALKFGANIIIYALTN